MTEKTAHKPIDILCRYLVKPDKGPQFEQLLAEHWQTLHQVGLTTDTPATVRRAEDKAGHIAFIEEFAWKNPQAVQSAHESPQVMQLWEPMGALCDDMEFWNVRQIGH